MDFSRAAAASALVHSLLFTVGAGALHRSAPRLDFNAGNASIQLNASLGSRAVQMLAAPEAGVEEEVELDLTSLRPSKPAEPVDRDVVPAQPQPAPQPTPSPRPPRRPTEEQVARVERTPPKIPTTPESPPGPAPAPAASPERHVRDARPMLLVGMVAIVRQTTETASDDPALSAPLVKADETAAIRPTATTVKRMQRSEAPPDVPAPAAPATPESEMLAQIDVAPTDAPAPAPRTSSPQPNDEQKVKPLQRADVGEHEITFSSVDSIASPQTVERTRRAPRGLPTNRLPEYPFELQQGRVEGVVLLELVIRPNGTVSEAKVKTSSGYTAFDDSALRAARSWRFEARRGETENSVFSAPVRFNLRSTSSGGF